MGPHAPSKSTVYEWFNRFADEDFELTDKPRSGRPPTADHDAVLHALEDNPDYSVRKLSAATGVPYSTVRRSLHEAGKVPKKPTLVPHELTHQQMNTRVEIATLNLHQARSPYFLKSIIAQDEKWVSYENPTASAVWVDAADEPPSCPKRDLHCKKELLSFWFCSSGPIFWEVIPHGMTVNANVICTELEEVAHRLRSVCPGHRDRILLFDNARPHKARLTQAKLESLGFSILPHPPYSPDLSPCDYHVFRSLQSFCDGRRFANKQHVESAVQDWIDSRPKSFWKEGIEALPMRWERVKASNGNYVTLL
jgi:histone-lysine N-methyltransferase SETMAR